MDYSTPTRAIHTKFFNRAPGRLTSMENDMQNGLSNNTSGARLRHLREAVRLTRQDLAELIGVSDSAIEKWENESRGLSHDRLAQIAQALDVDESALLPDPEPRRISISAPPEVLIPVAAPARGEQTLTVPERQQWANWMDDWMAYRKENPIWDGVKSNVPAFASWLLRTGRVALPPEAPE